MHSSEGPSGRTYHHTSEGYEFDAVQFEVIVRTQAATISIDMRDILWLAAQHVRNMRIQRLENLTDAEILGMFSDALDT